MSARFGAVAEALRRDDVARAWDAAAPLRPLLVREPEVARMWLHLLRLSPGREGRAAEAGAVLDAHPEDEGLVLGAAQLLLEEDEAAPMDTPRAPAGPAAVAARALRALLAHAGAAAAAEEDPAGWAELQRTLGGCLRLLGRAEGAAAAAAFEAALALRPEDWTLWYDAGLCHKYAGRFTQGLACFRRALQAAPAHDGALWNVGTCATAFGDATSATEAWAALRVPPKGGKARVRVRVSSAGPVAQGGLPAPGDAPAYAEAWVQPRSPCHGVVVEVTQALGRVEPGSLVLWDAGPQAPEGGFVLLAVLGRVAPPG